MLGNCQSSSVLGAHSVLTKIDPEAKPPRKSLTVRKGSTQNRTYNGSECPHTGQRCEENWYAFQWDDGRDDDHATGVDTGRTDSRNHAAQDEDIGCGRGGAQD